MNILKKSVEQRAAEAEVDAFRRHLGPFVVAAEATRMPMVFTNAGDPRNPIIFANDSFLRLTGYRREEVLAQSFNFLMECGGDEPALRAIEASFSGSSEAPPEIQYRRKDGSEFCASIFITPVPDDHGVVAQYFISLVDLSAERLNRAKSAMFIDELNHRVKNTLATVQSIVWQAFRNAAGQNDAREAIESRLFALCRSHDLLTLEQWGGVKLHDLVETAMEPFGMPVGGSERITITGSNLRLPPNTTLALAIALHELATNAIKYGSLSSDTGSLSIAWHVAKGSGHDRLMLKWEERGGPMVAPPTRKGFGSDVLERGLAHELQGEVRLDYRPAGLVCSIDIPVLEINHGS